MPLETLSVHLKLVALWWAEQRQWAQENYSSEFALVFVGRKKKEREETSLRVTDVLE